MTPHEVVNGVIEFLEVRRSIGGALGQEPYRGDFFNLFREAYERGYMELNHRPYLSADGLRELINARWEAGTVEDRTKLTDRACSMWQEWKYAWEKYPR